MHAIERDGHAECSRADDAPGPRDAFQSARRPSSFHQGRDRGTSRAAWLHVWFVARRAWSPGPAGADRGGLACSDLSPLTREDGRRGAVPHGVSLAAFGSSWPEEKRRKVWRGGALPLRYSPRRAFTQEIETNFYRLRRPLTRQLKAEKDRNRASRMAWPRVVVINSCLPSLAVSGRWVCTQPHAPWHDQIRIWRDVPTMSSLLSIRSSTISLP
jgi:hypothetical protein